MGRMPLSTVAWKQRLRGHTGFRLDVYVACTFFFFLIIIITDSYNSGSVTEPEGQPVCTGLCWGCVLREGGEVSEIVCNAWSERTKCVCRLFRSFCFWGKGASLLTCLRQLSYRRMNVRVRRVGVRIVWDL